MSGAPTNADTHEHAPGWPTPEQEAAEHLPDPDDVYDTDTDVENWRADIVSATGRTRLEAFDRRTTEVLEPVMLYTAAQLQHHTGVAPLPCTDEALAESTHLWLTHSSGFGVLVTVDEDGVAYTMTVVSMAPSLGQGSWRRLYAVSFSTSQAVAEAAATIRLRL